jgi:hypothetical protein
MALSRLLFFVLVFVTPPTRRVLDDRCRVVSRLSYRDGMSCCPLVIIHGYVMRDDIDGEIGHSCRHGSASHSIKVCIVKKDNDAGAWAKHLQIVGAKPQKGK